MIAMRSASISASSRKCVVRTSVRPSRWARSSCQIERRECGSIPEVGSSRKRVEEPPMSEIARQSFRFWPPERTADLTWARSLSITIWRRASMALWSRRRGGA